MQIITFSSNVQPTVLLFGLSWDRVKWKFQHKLPPITYFVFERSNPRTLNFSINLHVHNRYCAHRVHNRFSYDKRYILNSKPMYVFYSIRYLTRTTYYNVVII